MATSIRKTFSRCAAALTAAVSLNILSDQLQAQEAQTLPAISVQSVPTMNLALEQPSSTANWLRFPFTKSDTETPSLFPEKSWRSLTTFFSSFSFPHFFTDTTEVVAGKKVTVAANVHEAFSTARIPADALIATCARESGCNPTAVNKTSKACGLMQLMTDHDTATLYEAVYHNAEKYGYIEEAKMVGRTYVKTLDDGTDIYDYFPVNEAAKKHLVQKCLDPKFNTDMHEGYTLPKIMEFEQQFGRPMTYGDLAGANNLGFRGWKIFVEQVEEDRRTGHRTSAPTFFRQHKNIFGNVSGNVSLLRYNKKHAKTVEQSYRDVVAHGGAEVIQIRNDNAPSPLLAGNSFKPYMPQLDLTMPFVIAQDKTPEPFLFLR